MAAAGLDSERFVPIQDGTKKSRLDHTDPKNQHPAGELDGNYGVMAGDGLVVVDIDDYRGTEDVPDFIEALPATFSVQTPHGGEHRYYAVDDPVNNSQEGWGEIRATNQYVVGPGSILDSCSKDWHDCSGDNDGSYTILADPDIAHIFLSAFPELTTKEARSPTVASTTSSKRMCLDDVDASFGELETRLQAFLGKNHRKALWDGRYSEAGNDE